VRAAQDALLRLLDLTARRGPTLLVGCVLLGLLLPPLAAAMRPLMPLAVFAYSLGAFLKVDAPAIRMEARRPAVLAAVLAWGALGAPALVLLAMHWSPLAGSGAATGLMLALLAPPATASVAVAAMLGLGAPLALIACVAGMLAAPLTLPGLAALGGAGAVLPLDPWSMLLHCGAIIGPAAVVAAVLRRRAGAALRAAPQLATGIAVLGLGMAALGAMAGVQALALERTGHAAALAGAAFAATLGLQASGALLFAGFGARVALVAGLLGGNRSFALALAAAGPALPEDARVALSFVALPLFLLPAGYAWILRQRCGAAPWPAPCVPALARCGLAAPRGMTRRHGDG